ncbi:MAG TPA: DNA polymerase III subunit epsilon [Woeseiaceae bacterium]|nr:DNA polymerase III subunit epsilon [Woeseiaceae bacterium]
MRQIVLDTETTGLTTAQGHRIIEVAGIEMINRRFTGREYHRFINPERDIDEGAERVHGISREDLEGQPRFADIAHELLEFIRGGELVIHNADFDVGFLEYELQLMQHPQPRISEHATVLDTLALARELHPGQRNSLDALCKRYQIDASRRDVHGALIDAELLANVYLAMTGGQAALSLEAESLVMSPLPGETGSGSARVDLHLVVRRATAAELSEHEAFLDRIEKAANGESLWRKLQFP